MASDSRMSPDQGHERRGGLTGVSAHRGVNGGSAGGAAEEGHMGAAVALVPDDLPSGHGLDRSVRLATRSSASSVPIRPQPSNAYGGSASARSAAGADAGNGRRPSRDGRPVDKPEVVQVGAQRRSARRGTTPRMCSVRAPRQGLDAESARAGEEIEHDGVGDGVEAGERVEHRLPHTVTGRPSLRPTAPAAGAPERAGHHAPRHPTGQTERRWNPRRPSPASTAEVSPTG